MKEDTIRSNESDPESAPDVPREPQFESTPADHQDPHFFRKMMEILRTGYKQYLQAPNKTGKKVIEEKFREELGDVERLATREGVDFSRCQMYNIIAAYLSGKPVEVESFSPYLQNYDKKKGFIWGTNLVAADAIGMEIMRMVRELLPRVRRISLYDEYNNNKPIDAAKDDRDPFFLSEVNENGQVIKDAWGNPISEDCTPFPEEARAQFLASLEQLLRDNDVLTPEDTPGKDYLFISESSKIQDAEKLVQQLETAGHIQRDGEKITFVNPEAENPLYRKITLRTQKGRWLCEALDASTYLNPENQTTTHLVILPESFREQQDKVWEILRTLNIKPDNYHNIFFDDKRNAEDVTRVIQEEIEYYQNKLSAKE